jgi:hypothetical protein
MIAVLFLAVPSFAIVEADDEIEREVNYNFSSMKKVLFLVVWRTDSGKLAP